MPLKLDAPTSGHFSGQGQAKRRPSSMIFLTQAATKNTTATRWQGVLPVSRGQGCSTTLGHFLIPGPTPKIQDNEIKIFTWSSQPERSPHFPIRTKQESTGHEAVNDPTLADAILDRLIHNAYKINLKGESMKKKQLASLTGDKTTAA
ncbi:hypothetical protein DFAR_1340033 [Desulfarculales bacterium]